MQDTSLVRAAGAPGRGVVMSRPEAGASPVPLGDDWLCWDPEQIHCYPEEGHEPRPRLEAEPGPRRWPALEVLGLLVSGFAVGLIAGAVMVTVVLVMG